MTDQRLIVRGIIGSEGLKSLCQQAGNDGSGVALVVGGDDVPRRFGNVRGQGSDQAVFAAGLQTVQHQQQGVFPTGLEQALVLADPLQAGVQAGQGLLLVHHGWVLAQLGAIGVE